MKRIITIGREFGSGGREVGRRLAEKLNVAYYDREIVDELIKRTQLAESYVLQVEESRPLPLLPITTARTFGIPINYPLENRLSIYKQESEIIREMAEKSDCIIVGRCADYILQDLKPFRLFIYTGFCADEYEHTSHIVIFYNSYFQRPCGFMLHGRCSLAPCLGRKGVRKMMTTEQYREHIERTFNAFCKIVLYHAALSVYKKLRKKQQFEVSLDYLREFDFEPVTTTDEYFVKYDVPTTFAVHGETVVVESEQLATALLHLTEMRREVLLLCYYLGYSDEEIGKMCNISRSAVFRRRKIALYLLRKEMEAIEDEE